MDSQYLRHCIIISFLQFQPDDFDAFIKTVLKEPSQCCYPKNVDLEKMKEEFKTFLTNYPGNLREDKNGNAKRPKRQTVNFNWERCLEFQLNYSELEKALKIRDKEKFKNAKNSIKKYFNDDIKLFPGMNLNPDNMSKQKLNDELDRLNKLQYDGSLTIQKLRDSNIGQLIYTFKFHLDLIYQDYLNHEN